MTRLELALWVATAMAYYAHLCGDEYWSLIFCGAAAFGLLAHDMHDERNERGRRR